MSQQLQWVKCQHQQWCPFMTLDLTHPSLDGLGGVYIISHVRNSPWTVRVGQGIVNNRISAHRLDPAILSHLPSRLFVTYASVNEASRHGVERFLAERLQPRVPIRDARYPDTPPIVVNLPW